MKKKTIHGITSVRRRFIIATNGSIQFKHFMHVVCYYILHRDQFQNTFGILFHFDFIFYFFMEK